MAPERIQPLVRHFQNAADVGRLLPVEKEIGLGGVRILVARAREKAERDQRVEEVARRARVQAQTPAERLEAAPRRAPAP